MKILYVTIIILIFSCLTKAQDKPEKLEVIHTNSAQQERVDGKIIRYLNGDVHLKQGEAELFCQHVKWYVDNNLTILEKDVKYIDTEKSLTANKVIYDNFNRIVKAIGQVVIEDSTYMLFSDKATFYSNQDKIIADNNVIMKNEKSFLLLTGQHIEYLKEKKYVVITGDPVLRKDDSTSVEEIKITGKKMEMFNDGQQVTITDSVKIIHKTGNATCNKAEFYKDDNRMLLQDNPIVTQKYDKLTGDEIELFFEEQELKKVQINTNALITQPADTNDIKGFKNKMFGDKISISIHKKKIEQVIVEGKSTSLYHYYDENTHEYKGMNKIIGDKITMYLNNSQIKDIFIESDPGTSDGIYYPPGVKIKDNN